MINIMNIEYEPQKYTILQEATMKELPFRCTYSHREAKFKNFTLSGIKEADSCVI